MEKGNQRGRLLGRAGKVYGGAVKDKEGRKEGGSSENQALERKSMAILVWVRQRTRRRWGCGEKLFRDKVEMGLATYVS
jgi:hypothetical protein